MLVTLRAIAYSPVAYGQYNNLYNNEYNNFLIKNKILKNLW